MAEIFNKIVSNKLPNEEIYFNIATEEYYNTSSKYLYINIINIYISLSRFLLYLAAIPGSISLYNLTFLIYCCLRPYNTLINSKYLIYVMRVNTKKHTNNILYSLYSFSESLQQYLIYSNDVRRCSLYKIDKK